MTTLTTGRIVKTTTPETGAKGAPRSAAFRRFQRALLALAADQVVAGGEEPRIQEIGSLSGVLTRSDK
jgi:hypothetical protein